MCRYSSNSSKTKNAFLELRKYLTCLYMCPKASHVLRLQWKCVEFLNFVIVIYLSGFVSFMRCFVVVFFFFCRCVYQKNNFFNRYFKPGKFLRKIFGPWNIVWLFDNLLTLSQFCLLKIYLWLQDIILKVGNSHLYFQVVATIFHSWHIQFTQRICQESHLTAFVANCYGFDVRFSLVHL